MTTTAPDPWCCCCTRASPTVACGHPWRRHWPGASGWCATTYAGTASPRRHRSPSPITRTSRDYSTTWASSAPRWPAARSALEQIDVRALDPPANERLARVTVPALVTAGAAGSLRREASFDQYSKLGLCRTHRRLARERAGDQQRHQAGMLAQRPVERQVDLPQPDPPRTAVRPGVGRGQRGQAAVAGQVEDLDLGRGVVVQRHR